MVPVVMTCYCWCCCLLVALAMVSLPVTLLLMLPAVMGLSLHLVPAAVNLPMMLAFDLVYGAAEGLYVDLLPLTTLRLMGPRGGAEIAWTLLVGMVSIPWIIGPFVAGTKTFIASGRLSQVESSRFAAG